MHPCFRYTVSFSSFTDLRIFYIVKFRALNPSWAWVTASQTERLSVLHLEVWLNKRAITSIKCTWDSHYDWSRQKLLSWCIITQLILQRYAANCTDWCWYPFNRKLHFFQLSYANKAFSAAFMSVMLCCLGPRKNTKIWGISHRNSGGNTPTPVLVK